MILGSVGSELIVLRLFEATRNEQDAWLRECGKIYRVIECSDSHKLSFITFLLVADAEYWCQGMQQLMQTQEG